ncbi:MAG: hypothetical protein ACWA41_01370 [Putridiphycobacter sp.]
MKYLALMVGLLFVFSSCKTGSKELSEAEIDQIVTNISDPEKLYDISQSLRFTRADEQYDATRFSTNDTTVLYVENFDSEDKSYNRQIFYHENQPVFINEIGYKFTGDTEIEYQHKIYINNNAISAAYENIIDENTIDNPNFKKIDVAIEEYDLSRPKNAVEQQGDFEMKFGEFLIIAPESYLILENKSSNYNVALYIIEGDETLNALFENPEEYKGKTVFAYHEFMTISGIKRTVYRGSTIVD